MNHSYKWWWWWVVVGGWGTPLTAGVPHGFTVLRLCCRCLPTDMTELNFSLYALLTAHSLRRRRRRDRHCLRTVAA